MPKLNDFLFGSGFRKMPTMTKPQKEVLNQILGQFGNQGGLGGAYQNALGGLQQFMDPSSEAFEQFAAPYKTQFEQQTIPGLAERFAGAGPMGGALSSSGFGQALSSAGAGLESSLAGLKGQLMQQALQSVLGQYGQMAGLGLGAQPFGYQAPQQGFLPQLFISGAQMAPFAMTGGFGGPKGVGGM